MGENVSRRGDINSVGRVREQEGTNQIEHIRDDAATNEQDTKKIKSLKDPVKDAQEELKLISKVSKTLESNIKKGKPSTAEAKQIMAAVAEVEDVLELEEMPESVLEAWDDGSRSIDKIEQAFAL